MHQLCQWCMQDWILLLQWLVEVAKEWEEWTPAWWEEDLAHQERWWVEYLIWETAQKDTQDWAEWEFCAELLALEQECLKLLRQQNAIQAQALQAIDNDRQALGANLGLMVLCMPSTAWPLPLPHMALGTCLLPHSRPLPGPGSLPPTEALAQLSPWVHRYPSGPRPTTCPSCT